MMSEHMAGALDGNSTHHAYFVLRMHQHGSLTANDCRYEGHGSAAGTFKYWRNNYLLSITNIDPWSSKLIPASSRFGHGLYPPCKYILRAVTKCCGYHYLRCLAICTRYKPSSRSSNVRIHRIAIIQVLGAVVDSVLTGLRGHLFSFRCWIPQISQHLV